MNIELTNEELEQAQGNPNVMAQMLVTKTIEAEMAKKEFTEAEKQQLEMAKKNLEIDFFLTTLAQQNIVIQDYEILEVYKQNSEALKDKNMVEVFPQLRQALFNQKLGEAKVNIINGMIAQYGLNDILKKYAPQQENAEGAETAPEANN